MSPTNTEETAVLDAAPGHAAITLQNLCLDLQHKAESFRRSLEKFLAKNRRELELEETADLVQNYFDRIWPDGLPGSVIISSASFDQFDRWIFRPPVDGPLAASFAAGGLAAGFTAYRRQGAMVIDGFSPVPHVPPRSFERYVSAPIHFDNGQQMTAAEFSLLGQLPRPRQLTQQKLALWQEYLDWKQKLVFVGQIALRYESYKRTENGQIQFVVRTNRDISRLTHCRDTVLLAAALTESRSPQRWDPAAGQRANLIRLGPVQQVRYGANGRGHLRANQRVQNPQDETSHVLVTVQLDEDEDIDSEDEQLELPEQGFLLSAVGGDLKPIYSERRAIQRLLRGQSHNWYLPDILFDITNVAHPLQAQEDFNPSEGPFLLNDDQRQAIRKALAAPDMDLVQGPPGTGKTTVNADICWREGKGGRRVLIASQSNLAVDNVLSRISSDPVIRPLRIGNPDHIEPEFHEFLSPHVLRPWFRSIQHVCRQLIEQAQGQQTQLRQGHEALDRLTSLGGRFLENTHKLDALRERKTDVTNKLNELQTRRQQAISQLEMCKRQQNVLDELIAWTHNPTSVAPSLELLGQNPMLDIAAVAIRQLNESTTDWRWRLPWLAQATMDNNYNLAVISTASRIVSLADPLQQTVREALHHCGDSQTEDFQDIDLAELLQRKQRLFNSDRDEDLLVVARINRRIKDLQAAGWGLSCRKLQDYLQILFENQLPMQLENLTTSLAPESGWESILTALREMCAAIHTNWQPKIDNALGLMTRQAEQEQTILTDSAQRHELQLDEIVSQIKSHEISNADLDDEIESLEAALQQSRQRWGQLWPQACPDSPSASENIPEPDTAVLQERRTALQTWLEENHAAADRQDRWKTIQADWIMQLDRTDASQDSHLIQLYKDRANVVGLTCLEAGQRSFYDRQDFEPFDTVIIDEVSKCTPSELLMAMMLGRKVILVGDHRQLPPLLKEKESSFAEAVEEGRISAEDFQRFGQLVTTSFFEGLFEAAREPIRHSLWEGYRFHSQILAAVNQFYGGRLQPAGGQDVLDQRRQHHLTIRDRNGGFLLEPHQHLLWIDSSHNAKGKLFLEKQIGSSKVNFLEVDLIAASLVRLNTALKKRGYGSPCRHRVQSTESGLNLGQWVKQRLPHAPVETIDDFFTRNQVSIDGHPASPETKIRTGQRLYLDARMPVGIITFYGAQLGRIRRKVRQLQDKDPTWLDALAIRTNTVDKFQGMEMPIIIVSLVRSNPYRPVSRFVKEYKRINVALSRAQNLLIIVGSELTFRSVLIDLPGINGEGSRQVSAYANIYELAKQFGGRRYARDLLKW